MDDQFISAATNGKLELVKFLVSKGVDISAYDDQALKNAAENGHLELVKFLVSKGADISAYDNQALKNAAKNGHLGVLKFLVSKGADISTYDNQALKNAAKNGHLGVLKFLVSKGANIRAYDDEALRIAAEKGHLEVVKFLVSKGADISAHYDDPLRNAAQWGHLEVVKFLASKGANIRVYNDIVFRIAAENGHLEVVKFLVSKGANISANNNDALLGAAQWGHLEVVKFLFSKGANIDEDDIVLQATANNGHLEVVKFLVSKGADIGAYDDQALKNAAENGHLELVKFLVSKGANPETIKKTYPEMYRYLRPKLDVYKEIKRLVNLKDIYNWQSICRSIGDYDIGQLKQLTKLQKINTKDKTKRQICALLAQKMEKEMKKSVNNCSNLTSILGDEVSDILKPLLFKVTEGKQTFCFNVLELDQMVKKGETKNPFTKRELPVKQIKNKMEKLKKILVKERLNLVDVIEQIKTNPIFNEIQVQRQTLVDIFSKLNYAVNVNSFIKKLDNSGFRKDLIQNLRKTGVSINSNLDKGQLILEMVRITNTDQSHRLALEVAINEINSSNRASNRASNRNSNR